MKNKLPIIITVAASLGLILLAVSYYALYSARLSTVIFGDTAGLGPQQSSSLVVDDPLITFVPVSERGDNQKTKVFVSSQDPMLGSATAKVYVILYGSLLDEDMQTYLAAMVEYAASIKNVPPPEWIMTIPSLEKPVFGTELLSLRLHLLTHSPVPFRNRNIFIDSSLGDRI